MSKLTDYIGEGALMLGGIAAAPFTGGASLAATTAGQAMMQNEMNQSAVTQQNQYNTPSAQMARYRAAGLNPLLIYGQGNSGNQSSPVEVSAPTADVVGAKSKYLAMQAAQTQNEILKYNAEAAFQNIDRVAADALLKETKQLGEVTRNQLLNAYAFGQDGTKNYTGQIGAYQREALAQRTNSLLGDVSNKAATLLNLQADNLIKKEILSRERHYNVMRSLGIERTDNIFLRGGATLFQQYVPKIRQSFRMP